MPDFGANDLIVMGYDRARTEVEGCLGLLQFENKKPLRYGGIHHVGEDDGEIPIGNQDVGGNRRPLL